MADLANEGRRAPPCTALLVGPGRTQPAARPSHSVPAIRTRPLSAHCLRAASPRPGLRVSGRTKAAPPGRAVPPAPPRGLLPARPAGSQPPAPRGSRGRRAAQSGAVGRPGPYCCCSFWHGEPLGLLCAAG